MLRFDANFSSTNLLPTLFFVPKSAYISSIKGLFLRDRVQMIISII